MSSKETPRYAGIVWYREDQYDDLLKLFKDSHNLPPAFAGWLKRVTEDIDNFRRRGLTVVKVELDLLEFTDWCKATVHEPDYTGRIAFINEKLSRQLGLK